MNTSRSVSSLCLLGLLATCGQPEERGGPWVTPIETAVCGLEGYDWLDPATTGALVELETLDLYHWPKSLVNVAVDEAGYAGVIEAQYGTVVYRYRYETQDRGEKVEATGLVAFPEDPDAIEPLEVPWVLWLHGTTGFMDDCAPSADDRSDGALAALVVASQGFAVVAPDYIGLSGDGTPSSMFHPYLVREPTALAAWDAMRAATRLVQDETIPIADDRRVIIWGASQGGHATLLADLYASLAGRAWDVVASVPMIPAVDLVAQAEVAMESWTGASALISVMMVEHARWYGYDANLDQIITDEAPHHLVDELPAAIDRECSIDVDAYGIVEPSDLFRADFIAAATTDDWIGFEQWRCMFAESSLNSTSVVRGAGPPVLYVVAEQDQLLNPEAQRQSFDALCDKGYEMEYLECLGADHVNGAFWSLLEQLDWVRDRLAGEPLADPCVRTAPICCRGTDDGSCTP